MQFLTALFPDDVLRGPLRVNFRGLVHGGAPGEARSQFAPSVTALNVNGVGQQLAAWNDEGRSVYFAPGVRRGEVGSKDGVAGITAFWVDLDAKIILTTKALTPQEREERKARARRILTERLPSGLAPSSIVDTGGGLQAWWFLKEPAWINDDNYTVATLEGYLKGLAKHLGADPAVTHVAALMRVPGFVNRKYSDAPIAQIVTFAPDRRFNPTDFADYSLDRSTSAPRPRAADPETPLGQLRPVITTCGFVQWCRDHPAEVSEPLWYALLSNLVRLESGREAAHEFSKGYPGYSAKETDVKLDHALAASPPITCAKIQEFGFSGCPKDGHGVKSPAGLGWTTTRSAADAVVWPEPQPIQKDLAMVPALDRLMLPPALADWVWDVAERTQCPPDFVAVGAITATATVVGRRVGIRPKRHDDWTVVPNLWGMVIGRPGVLKSPALAESARPLHRLVADAQAAYEEELAKYRVTVAEQKAQREVLEARLKKAITNIKKGAGDIEEIKRELAALKEDDPPVERRYVTNDTTIEKLGELLNQNPNGLMVFRDELSGFLAAMDRQGHEGDRAFYLEAWNGTGSFTYDRIGRGTLHIKAACVSILGSIQPGPLGAYLREAFGGGRDDGFIQRFQVAVYPDTATVWRNVDQWPDSEAKARAFEVFKVLDTLDVRALGAAQEKDDETPYLRFSIDAQDFFDTWRTDLEERLRSDDEHPVIVSHLAKYRSLMPSLALIFQLVEVVGRDGTPGSAAVSLHAASCAAAWCDYLEAHARRIYQSVTARAETSASILAAKIRAGKLPDPFTPREVMKKAWTGLTTTEEIGPALDLLEELHWLRREEVRPPVGRPGVRFHVNPKAKGGT